MRAQGKPTLNLIEIGLAGLCYRAPSSTIQKEDFDYVPSYLWLFRTRMSVLRRQDLL